jgi:hypothetical protein
LSISAARASVGFGDHIVCGHQQERGVFEGVLPRQQRRLLKDEANNPLLRSFLRGDAVDRHLTCGRDNEAGENFE